MARADAEYNIAFRNEQTDGRRKRHCDSLDNDLKRIKLIGTTAMALSDIAKNRHLVENDYYHRGIFDAAYNKLFGELQIAVFGIDGPPEALTSIPIPHPPITIPDFGTTTQIPPKHTGLLSKLLKFFDLNTR